MGVVCPIRLIDLSGSISGKKRLQRLIHQRSIVVSLLDLPRFLQQITIDGCAHTYSRHATNMPRWKVRVTRPVRYRSTSPITGSIDAMVATVSATRLSAMAIGRPWRL